MEAGLIDSLIAVASQQMRAAPEVKLAVLKALEPVVNILLPRKDLPTPIYGDIPLLLAQYGKNNEAFYITKISQAAPHHSFNPPTLRVRVKAVCLSGTPPSQSGR
ncbi:uncharacterized protein ACDP82_017015 [Pangshura tecta]